MKALPVFDHWRQQRQFAALPHLLAESAAYLIACLALHWNLAVRAIRRAEPGEKQAHEMIKLRHGGHRAFATSAAGALLNADGGWDAGDQVDVRAAQLFHKLPR